MRFAIAVIALSTLAAGASAQDLGGPVRSTQGAGSAIGFTLRGGVGTAPEYPGSDSYEAAPALGGSLNYLRLGGFSFGDPDPLYRPTGFGAMGSLRYVPERDASDHDELEGLDDVDTTLELGGGLRYATPDWRVFGVVRYGAFGHEAFVGELGADLYARPTDRITLRAGPRALFGDGDYVESYFGVSGSEAVASGGNLSAYDPDGGLVSAGVEFSAGYQINETWGVDAIVTYEKLQGDAADSPVTENEDQFRASIGVTRRFTLGF
ncbi:MipA/OmpV family protein [uncultured Jannaschia sp.]|uniref:MipA/OmpV family protein n=1 Tax=uncultured Jannaschia sp. TaxID=293347 RepID=UPI00260A14AD|nr:MipA/OmpV family protein [uncultured Jannaschia sp.]